MALPSMVKHTWKPCILDKFVTHYQGSKSAWNPSASWLDTQALTVQLITRKCPVLALGASGPAPKYQAQDITSVDTKTFLLATGYTMKLIELGVLLGLFTFSLLTTH